MYDMFNMKVMLRFFDRSFILKLLFIALLYSLLPLSEIFLLLYIGGILGNYLTLALSATTGLFGMIVAIKEVRGIFSSLQKKIVEGYYPAKEFVSLAGILVGSALLLTPGFVTDIFGILLFFPFFRNWIGGLITSRLDGQLREIYEYLKLGEF